MNFWATVPFADEYLSGEISGQVWANSIQTLLKAGTISINKNSINVTGNSTDFTTSVENGDILFFGEFLLTVANIQNTTELTTTTGAPVNINNVDFLVVASESKANAYKNFAKKILCLEQAKRYIIRIPGLILPNNGSEANELLKQAQVLWANMLFNGTYVDQGFKVKSNVTSKKMGDASYDYDLSYSVSNIPSAVNDLISGLIQTDSFFTMD